MGITAGAAGSINRHMHIQQRPIDSIRPYPRNPRRNDRAVDTVARSIQQYGFQQPIVVDGSGVIVVGHTRYRAAKKLGMTQVPVLTADLPPKKIQAYRLMDNRAAEDSRWDDALLIDELRDLVQEDDLTALARDTGFRENELLRQFRAQEEPDLSRYTRDSLFHSQVGDIWHLGEHRLACGDSTDSALVRPLIQDRTIDCVWTDPPYGVAYETANGINYTPEENELRNHLIVNDAIGIEGVVELIKRQWQLVGPRLRPGAAIYMCHDIRYTHQLRTMLDELEIHVSDVLIWKKNNASTWLSDYAKFYEPIFYGWSRGAPRQWHARGMTPNCLELEQTESMTEQELRQYVRSQVINYQACAKETGKTARLHPTVKPTRLIAEHLANSTQPGDTIWDGFAGSGSTIMAAEQMQRRAVCCEFEPKFCDTIIRRWQAHTKETARRSTGEPFPEAPAP